MPNSKTENAAQPEQALFNELSQLIEQSRQQVLVQANSALTLLFWHIGKRINQNILQNKRAEYGKQIVVTLARQFASQYGKNFELRNVQRMMQFAEQFNDFTIVSTLTTQLSYQWFSFAIRERCFALFAQRQATHHRCVGKRS